MSQAVSAIKSLSSVASPSEPSSLRSTPVDSEVALARAHRLLHLEAQAREQPNEKALLYHLVNESRNVLNFKLALLFRRPHINARARITLASSLAEVEADAPAIRYMEDAVHALGPDKDLTSPCLFTLSDETSPDSLQGCAHTALWVPVSAPSAGVAAGLVLLNDRPFSEGDTLIAKRIADTYGHAWAALSGAKRIVPRRRIGMLYSLLLMVAIVIGAFVPVPLAILAPAEVVSAQSAVVAAPLEGVLQSVEVEPNQRVSSGQLLARFDVTRLRNDLELAEQKVLVADAKSRRAAQGAIASMEAKREMAVAKAELALARTERDYAKDLLLQADLRAPMDGVAAFSDRRDIEGRAFRVGEHIMDIADHESAELRVDVPVADAMALSDSAPVDVYLDAEPMHARGAYVERVAYHASPAHDGTLSYAVVAVFANAQTSPTIGSRGTAKLRGPDVPLYFYLLRRPITALRQYFGF